MQEHTPFGMLAKLIRQRQAEEGNTPCFATAESCECPNKNCCWHHECFDNANALHSPDDSASKRMELVAKA